MKRLLLMMMPVALASVSLAQERHMTLVNTPLPTGIDLQSVRKVIKTEVDSKKHPLKTTAAPRWYSFADYFDTSETDGGAGAALSNTYLWKDTSAVMAYSAAGGGTTWEHNNMVSLGLVIDPAFSGFNSTSYYLGDMKVTASDAYTVDSIRFFGIYGYEVANTYVDTIRVAFVYGDASRGNGTTGPDVYLAKTGNPSVLGNYGATDSMSTYRMHFDPNTTRTNGPTVVVRDLIIDNTTSTPGWGDTLSNGIFVGRVGLGDVGVPAGNLIGATLTFISGSPTFFVDDTVFGSSMGYKHNMFRPLMIHKGGVDAPSFATYSAENRNSGMFKTLPDTSLGWGGQYIPLWFWTSGGGASGLQYPYMDFRLKCPSCTTVHHVGVNDISRVSTASAFPNPATEELNIPFTLTGHGDVTVTLSNMMGQAIATQNMKNVENGKAVFNTRELPAGVYIYTVVADKHRFTGRVSVMH